MQQEDKAMQLKSSLSAAPVHAALREQCCMTPVAACILVKQCAASAGGPKEDGIEMLKYLTDSGYDLFGEGYAKLRRNVRCVRM